MSDVDTIKVHVGNADTGQFLLEADIRGDVTLGRLRLELATRLENHTGFPYKYVDAFQNEAKREYADFLLLRALTVGDYAEDNKEWHVYVTGMDQLMTRYNPHSYLNIRQEMARMRYSC